MGPLRLHVVGIVLVLLAVSCGGEAVTARDSGEEWHFLRDEQAGISVRYPSGWDATSRPLTEVVSPLHRLAVASFGLAQPEPDPDCSPTTALRSLPQDGAFIVVFESHGSVDDSSWGKDVPSRPAQFTIDSASFANYECFGPSYRIMFVEQGRIFQAHVSFGADATPETRARALGVLDSLEVAATP